MNISIVPFYMPFVNEELLTVSGKLIRMSKVVLRYGCVAQSVEQWPFKPTVEGSIPPAPTRRNNRDLFEVSVIFI